MSRVLIWKKVYHGSEYDIFHRTNYAELYDHVQKEWSGNGQNWGNKLWLQGIYSEIDTGENEYFFLTGKEVVEEINDKYDFIILPMANIFYRGYKGAMQELSEIFSKIKIPIYVIACGVQAESYNDLESVIHDIGKVSSKFIDSIYETGGEFALRGYFTKEFFDKLGFNSAVVTGCPSLYQFGSEFTVCTSKEDVDNLRPMFNGYVKPFENLLKTFPESIFMDQCDYFDCLYNPDYLKDSNIKFQMNFVMNYGKYAAHLLGDNRISMIADMNEWYYYLKAKGFNYSFGSRIHGTIMALLSGIPATIVCYDSRTREMAEFFDIPHLVTTISHKFVLDEMCELYAKADYTRFNNAFREKYDVFEKFLTDRKIVTRVNAENHFFKEKETIEFDKGYVNTEKFRVFSEKLDKNAFFLNLGNKARKIIRR